MDMSESKARRSLLGMVSSVRKQADLRRTKNRIGGFVGSRRRIVDSVRIRIVPCL